MPEVSCVTTSRLLYRDLVVYLRTSLLRTCVTAHLHLPESWKSITEHRSTTRRRKRFAGHDDSNGDQHQANVMVAIVSHAGCGFLTSHEEVAFAYPALMQKSGRVGWL